jgi:hypothetical protein
MERFHFIEYRDHLPARVTGKVLWPIQLYRFAHLSDLNQEFACFTKHRS